MLRRVKNLISWRALTCVFFPEDQPRAGLGIPWYISWAFFLILKIAFPTISTDTCKNMKALFRFIDKGRSKNPGLLYSSNGCNIHIDGNIKVLLVAGVRKMPFPSPRPSFRRPLRSLKHSYHTSFPHSSPVVYILPLSLSPHSSHPALLPRPVPRALWDCKKTTGRIVPNPTHTPSSVNWSNSWTQSAKDKYET